MDSASEPKVNREVKYISPLIMATSQQREYNHQTQRILAHETKQPLSLGSWWIGVDRQTFPAVARDHRERMKRSRFSKNWITEAAE